MPQRKASKAAAEAISKKDFYPKQRRGVDHTIQFHNELAQLSSKNLKDVEKSTKPVNRRNPNTMGANDYLFQLVNKEDRTSILKEAAQILSDRESAILPTYGGRFWTVKYELKEDRRLAMEIEKRDRDKRDAVARQKAKTVKPAKKKPSKKMKFIAFDASAEEFKYGPLFRFYEHQAELAILPKLITDMNVRVLGDLRGLTNYRCASEYDYECGDRAPENHNKDEQSEEVTSMVVDLENCKPAMRITWISPQYEKCNQWEDVIECCKKLAYQEKMIDGIIYGVGSKGALLKPQKPTLKQALEAGKYRFERDGIWVVGQEEQWQLGNEMFRKLKKSGIKKDKGSQAKNSIKWKMWNGKQVYLEDFKHDYTKTKRKQIEKEWAKNGKPKTDEDEEPPPPPADGKKPRKKRKLTSSGVYTLGMATMELSKMYDNIDAEEQNEYDVRAMVLNFDNEEEALSRERSNEKQRRKAAYWANRKDRPKHWDLTPPTDAEIKTSKTIGVEVGCRVKCRFDDGMWYGGEILEIEDEVKKGIIVKKWLTIEYDDGEQEEEKYPDKSIVVLPPEPDQDDMEIDQGEEKKEDTPTKATATTATTATTTAITTTTATATTTTTTDALPEPPAEPEEPCLPPTGKADSEEYADWLNLRKLQWREQRGYTGAPPPPPSSGGGGSSKKTASKAATPAPIPAATIEEAKKLTLKQKHEANLKYVSQPCRMYSTVEDSWLNATCTAYNEEEMIHTFQFTRTKFRELNIEDEIILWEKDTKAHTGGENEYKGTEFRLKPNEITTCYNLACDHYESVMRTVKSKGLLHELQDGFDMMRERGFQRFDLTIPAYDALDFLTSTNAAWIPIVHACLGQDVELAHVGCMFSLPGSHAQVYHQDGVHLSEKQQLDCHAVNVFIPLIDLSVANGATEFCIGTHILENDAYDRSKLQTPTPEAGVPLVFDYRNGHRGMGNNTEEVRPIVYLTYSANGKFTDEVNFSKRRYHKLGDMVAAPKSREERKKNREGDVVKEEMTSS